MRRFIYLVFLSTAICFYACDVNDPTEFKPEYVVESYLFAAEPLPELKLSQTVPFGEQYVFEEQAVSNAIVKLRLMSESGGVEKEYLYGEQQKGIYRAANSADRVLPLREYSMEITFPDDDALLTSSTTVPDSFKIVQTSGDTVVFLSTEQLEITVTPSFTPGRQNVFIFSTEAFDVRFENLTPFFKDFFDEGKDGIEDFRINESPPINEENYDRNPDGTLTIKLPWIAVSFFGENRISANAIDDNIFNFITSQNLQFTPSTLSPGEIPDVIDPIEGGRGIFGSFARVTKDIFIAKPGQ